MPRYSFLRDSLETGDIILFSGNSFISHLIRMATRSDYSHVGMVLKFNGYDSVFLWESTKLSNVGDILSGKKKNGVQITLLSERIENYNGSCVLRRLASPSFTSAQIDSLNQLRRELRNRPYERNKKELILSLYDNAGGKNEEDLSSVFCSELVAEAYQRLGLIPSDRKPSNEYLPCDFSEEREDIEFLDGVRLAAEIHIE